VSDAEWRLAFDDRPRVEVVRDYLAFADTGVPEAEYAMTAVDGMNDRGFPREAQWELLLELVRAAPTDNALAFVAEVPLHEFLWHHEEAFADRVVEEAWANARFARALGRVGLTFCGPARDRIMEAVAAVPPLPAWQKPWERGTAEPGAAADGGA
jgi:hypothetical protein